MRTQFWDQRGVRRVVKANDVIDVYVVGSISHLFSFDARKLRGGTVAGSSDTIKIGEIEFDPSRGETPEVVREALEIALGSLSWVGS